MDSEFPKPISKQIMTAVRKIPQLRAGKVYIMLDHASVYRSKLTLKANKVAW